MSEKTTAKAIKADLAQKQPLEPVPPVPVSRPLSPREYAPGLPPMTLVAKLAQVMAAVERVAKRGHNDHFNYDFATESDITAAIRAEMASRSLMLIPDVQSVSFREVNGRNGIQTIGQVLVKFTVKDGESGEEFSFQMPGEGQDSGDKCLPKAITSALKYALLKLFMIPTGDDPEREGKEPRQKAAPKAQDAPRRDTAAEKPAFYGALPPKPVPANVDPVTGEEYPPCPLGAVYVLKYAFDRGMHTALISDMVKPEQAREVQTKFDQGLTLKAACETKRPVVVTMNAKGYLTKCDWYVASKGPVAKKLATALGEDEPPVSAYDDERTPF
jgi:hypothetical protein